jgi:DNA-directed RNA polymerase subunit RPC12/RpoP
MYFKCKSCGSNEYSIKKDQVLCNYCGSSYFYEQKSEEQESKNGLLIPILLFGLVVGIFIYISIGFTIFCKLVLKRRNF